MPAARGQPGPACSRLTQPAGRTAGSGSHPRSIATSGAAFAEEDAVAPPGTRLAHAPGTTETSPVSTAMVLNPDDSDGGTLRDYTGRADPALPTPGQ